MPVLSQTVINMSNNWREGGDIRHNSSQSLYQGWAGYFFGRIPDIRLIYNAGNRYSSGYMANVRYPAKYWISGIRNQPVTGIRIVSILSIRPDIENNWLSGQTLYLAEPQLLCYTWFTTQVINRFLTMKKTHVMFLKMILIKLYFKQFLTVINFLKTIW